MMDNPCTASVDGDLAFSALRELFVKRTGLAYYNDNQHGFRRGVSLRMSELGLSSHEAYRNLLARETSQREWDQLVEELVVSETFFFRYPDQFRLLRETAIPDRISRKSGERSLTVWSAGCATGAEPYSVNMLLRRDMAHQVDGWDISIIGADISDRNLAKARAAVFTDWDLRTMPQPEREACFEKVGNKWRVRDQFRTGVSFVRMNFAGSDFRQFVDANRERFDLVLCRNVLIYFDPEFTHRVLRDLYDVMAPDAWLCVGHAEPYMDIANVFTPVFRDGTFAYRKGVVGVPALLPDGSLPPAGKAQSRAPAPPSYRHVVPAVTETVATPSIAPLPEVPPRIPTEDPRDIGKALPSDESDVGAARGMANRGEWDAAETCCRRVIESDEFNAEARFVLALVLEFKGQLEDCARMLRSAIYIDRKFVLAHYHLGLISARTGSLDEARKSLRNAQRLSRMLDEDTRLVAGEGLTAGELAELAMLQSRTLEGRRS